MPNPTIEILLPIYNEVANLVPLLRELDRVAGFLKKEANIRYLFINDGSNDGSAQLLHRLTKQREDIRVVDLIHNFGHSAALACGIDLFEGDALVIMDADLQDSPDALISLYETWKKGAKTVVVERGERPERNGFLFRTFYFLLHKTAQQLPPMDFGTHCLLDREVVERLRKLPEKNRYLPGLVALSSGPVASILLDRGQRLNGKSRVGKWGLLQLAITALVSFSTVPIRLVSFFGIACSASALLGGISIVCIKLFTHAAIPGWASMMTAIMFASGVQLLCLGLMGEYVARIYEEVKQRPLYWVQNIHNGKAAAKKAS